MHPKFQLAEWVCPYSCKRTDCATVALQRMHRAILCSSCSYARPALCPSLRSQNLGRFLQSLSPVCGITRCSNHVFLPSLSPSLLPSFSLTPSLPCTHLQLFPFPATPTPATTTSVTTCECRSLQVTPPPLLRFSQAQTLSSPSRPMAL